MSVIKLDHLVLLASNLAESAAFYDAVLTRSGFVKLHDWSWRNQDGLTIDVQETQTDLTYDRHAPGLNHFGFQTTSKDAFDETLEALENANIDLPKVQRFGEAVAIFLPDPDGLRVEIGWDPAMH